MAHAIALGLVTFGVVVTGLSVLGAVAVGDDVFLRLHFLTPITTVAAPLIGVGLSIESGQPWVIAEVLLICLLVLVSGPVLESAAARLAAQRRDLADAEQPQ